MRVLVIIPAKLDSKRLSNKNILNINGKQLVEYSIDYAKQCKFNPDIIVSSENNILKSITDKHNVIFHQRDISLCGDTEVVDVYISIIKEIHKDYDLVVCLQPDNPDRDHTLDTCIDYMIDNNYDDLITVNSNFKRSGSVRIFKYDYLKHSLVSKRIGCMQDNATDIHYESDLIHVTNKLK
jgi:CMP-N,N'-diacetyllegionaminic acid synthase